MIADLVSCFLLFVLDFLGWKPFGAVAFFIGNEGEARRVTGAEQGGVGGQFTRAGNGREKGVEAIREERQGEKSQRS